MELSFGARNQHGGHLSGDRVVTSRVTEVGSGMLIKFLKLCTGDTEVFMKMISYLYNCGLLTFLFMLKFNFKKISLKKNKSNKKNRFFPILKLILFILILFPYSNSSLLSNLF
jgi:glucan phosphoethanolaminetransferase (alkaline phosphatase superfamily)